MTLNVYGVENKAVEICKYSPSSQLSIEVCQDPKTFNFKGIQRKYLTVHGQQLLEYSLFDLQGLLAPIFTLEIFYLTLLF